jgi:hypothetical protein
VFLRLCQNYTNCKLKFVSASMRFGLYYNFNYRCFTRQGRVPSPINKAVSYLQSPTQVLTIRPISNNINWNFLDNLLTLNELKMVWQVYRIRFNFYLMSNLLGSRLMTVMVKLTARSSAANLNYPKEAIIRKNRKSLWPTSDLSQPEKPGNRVRNWIDLCLKCLVRIGTP